MKAEYFSEYVQAGNPFEAAFIMDYISLPEAPSIMLYSLPNCLIRPFTFFDAKTGDTCIVIRPIVDLFTLYAAYHELGHAILGHVTTRQHLSIRKQEAEADNVQTPK